MIDIFLQKDINALLKSKSVVFMGDSNIRGIYKDFLCLMQQTELIQDSILKNKMENSVFGDKLVCHGERNNGRDYREEREATTESAQLDFYFLTRVYDDYMEFILKKITSKPLKPDVIVINSCLWDITRWGSTGVEKYKENLQTLMKRLKELLPDFLVIWMTAPPISCEMKGGFLAQELNFLKYSLRFHVMEANHFARKVVVENGFDILDCHHHLKLQLHRREGDGIHWVPSAIRYITNLLLTHISLAWNIPLPHRYKSQPIDETSGLVVDETLHKEDIECIKSNSPAIDILEKLPESSNSENLTVNKFKDEESSRLPPKSIPRNPRSHHQSHNSVNSVPYRRKNPHAYLNSVEHNRTLQDTPEWQNQHPGYSISVPNFRNPSYAFVPNSINSLHTLVPNFPNPSHTVNPTSINSLHTFLPNNITLNSSHAFVPSSIHQSSAQSFYNSTFNVHQSSVSLFNSNVLQAASNLDQYPNLQNVFQHQLQNFPILQQSLQGVSTPVFRFLSLLSHLASQRR